MMPCDAKAFGGVLVAADRTNSSPPYLSPPTPVNETYNDRKICKPLRQSGPSRARDLLIVHDAAHTAVAARELRDAL